MITSARRWAGGAAIVVAAFGAMAGCGSASSGPPAPRQPPSSQAPASQIPSTPAPASQGTSSPASDLNAWVAAGGATALAKFSADASALPAAPANAQLDQLAADIAAARAIPMPRSVDPAGAYDRALTDMSECVSACKSGDFASGARSASAVEKEISTLNAEMTAASAGG
jgi:hypothetical protein